MQLSILLNAAALAAPGEGASASDIEEYLGFLLNAASAARTPETTLCLTRRTSEHLATDGCYPLRPALAAALRQNGIVEFDANTIAVLAETILQTAFVLEDEFEIDDILAAITQLEPEIRVCFLPACNQDLERCISIACLLKSLKLTRREIVIGLPYQASGVSSLRAAVEVQIAETRVLDRTIALPARITSHLAAFSGATPIVSGLDEIELWRSADSSESLRRSVALGLLKRDRQLARSFSFADGFLESAHFWASRAPAERVYRAVLATILREDMRATHGLRIRRGGNSPQIRKEGKLAFRRDIDHELHLHYWECRDESVELVKVTVHNDFSID
jgi:hypothetical protein